MCGLSDVVVAGGTESMSNAVFYVRNARWGVGTGTTQFVDALTEGQFYSQPQDIYGSYNMGATAENVADTATKKVNLSLKATKFALASLGIGLVILAVSTLVEHWEDLCGWFDKSFPIFKKCGGVFNTLKGVVIGFGKAVIQWITNPWKTVFEMFQKALSGDFAGALQAGIDGIKNQTVGLADAFKEGFQGQVEKGLEEMTLKTVEETNKQTQQQLKELKIQERNNKMLRERNLQGEIKMN